MTLFVVISVSIVFNTVAGRKKEGGTAALASMLPFRLGCRLKGSGKSSRHALARHGSKVLWALLDRSDGLTDYGNR